MNDVKNLISHLLQYATKQGADLHLCPKSAPFVRLGGKNGVLTPVPDYDSPLELATIKAIVGELLTPEQKGELQKNKFLDFSFIHGNLGRFRACVYTQRGTHAVTIHTLPFEIPDIHKLGLSNAATDEVERIIMESTGFIIVAGDCFSGISVTLAALVDLINQRRNCHISTIESPIEYLHRHKKGVVVQKELGADVADFNTALSQIRHENSDVLAISELQQADFLSVMELAEERLVVASIKTNQLHKDCAGDVIGAVRKISYNEAAWKNRIMPFIPNPRFSVIFQHIRDSLVHGELITWNMCDNTNEKKEFLLKPITFGRSADNATGDG